MALIKGRVVDAAGRPVAMASVYVVSSPQPMPDIAQIAGPDGEFVVSAPAAGTYVLGARADASGTGQASVTIESANDQRIEIKLK